MNIKKEDVKTFLYEGNDEMIDFENDNIPKPSSDFKAQLRLKNGKIVIAPSEWRGRIWEWWYFNRKNEIQGSILIQVGRSLIAKPPSYRKG